MLANYICNVAKAFALKPCISLLEDEGEVDLTNLSNLQWIIVEDFASLLTFHDSSGNIGRARSPYEI